MYENRLDSMNMGASRSGFIPHGGFNATPAPRFFPGHRPQLARDSLA